MPAVEVFPGSKMSKGTKLECEAVRRPPRSGSGTRADWARKPSGNKRPLVTRGGRPRGDHSLAPSRPDADGCPQTSGPEGRGALSPPRPGDACQPRSSAAFGPYGTRPPLSSHDALVHCRSRRNARSHGCLTDPVLGGRAGLAIRREPSTPAGAGNVEEGERAGWRLVARVQTWSSSTSIS